MSNAVMMCLYNQVPEQLDLTKDAVATVLNQDIPVDVFLVDNGSTDDGATWESLQDLARFPNVCITRHMVNRPPVKIANEMMADIFGRLGYRHVLGIPNDVILPTFLYREFLKWPRGIVTGSMTDDRNYDIEAPVHVDATSENTPLAVALYRRWAYDALIDKDGYFFDERYEHYCSDCDWALRTASCGIRGVQLNVPYYHYGSASHRLAPADDGERMRSVANTDRQKFTEKWGFGVADLEYGQRAVDINFRG